MAKANQKKSPGRGKKGSPNCVDLLPVDTQKALAKEAQVSHDTIARGEWIRKHANKQTLAMLARQFGNKGWFNLYHPFTEAVPSVTSVDPHDRVA